MAVGVVGKWMRMAVKDDQNVVRRQIVMLTGMVGGIASHGILYEGSR